MCVVLIEDAEIKGGEKRIPRRVKDVSDITS